jgi:hypothetical protein
LRGWMRRHRQRLDEIRVMPPASLRRYEKLLASMDDPVRLRAG